MLELYKWQKDAVARFARAAYFALVVDCGLGKTAAAILVALKKKRPVMVVAPGKLLCDQWKEEILKIAGSEEDVRVYSRAEETKRGDAYRDELEAWLKR
jgi:superfamily II DNA or RNA helicase